MHAPCAGQDAEAITAAVDEYYRSAYKMAKAARDDRVVAKVCVWDDEVEVGQTCIVVLGREGTRTNQTATSRRP